MDKLTVRDIEVGGKRVLLRVDFNVPLNKETGAITDDNRIRATLPTIKYLIEKKAKVILVSHLGRPKGKVVESMRLKVVAQRLSELLGQPVATTKDCIGPEVEKAIAGLKGGDVILLENLRFHPEEEAGDDSFAKALARLADVYVNDAFGAAHRAHASITGVAKYLPAAAGFLLEKEIVNLGGILKNPAHPFVALLGGAKVSDKISMLENIMGKIDSALIGGAMAATFLKAKSFEVGRSLIEPDKVDFASKLMDEAAKRKVRFLLPVDVVVAEELTSEAAVKTVPVEKIEPQLRIVDIGTRTIELFSRELQGCKTVFWNGPMGIYETPRFAEGTKRIARFIAGIRATTIIGGGSTAEIITDLNLADKMTFVSTGGGASLEFLSGEPLPGVEALLDKK